jgi:Tfp pilus assembly protein PilN
MTLNAHIALRLVLIAILCVNIVLAVATWRRQSRTFVLQNDVITALQSKASAYEGLIAEQERLLNARLRLLDAQQRLINKLEHPHEFGVPADQLGGGKGI